ncbi:primosomal protein DnaI [Bacillus amyloliquefaciens]|uniref:Primosomal protein DnaI n=1 Tax=Bacillus amyloliquefaciens TaxID=1390 RepID=A0AAP7N6U4_BACAM|nr:primosomal protein DnaI [Bacillus amyloliquefaciens]MEC3838908.1 primosomal protein DnaI [Bacillus amyloliquefaciens]OIK20219.1 primosomal protein DnaI [Bacillus amyloliquefaciens]QBG57354.1 primosomal protein DnaI [Bacillus amyloliquefaciens]QOQ54062.1 primosomal protein DnaI [Bacillus amyloliquefaciens]
MEPISRSLEGVTKRPDFQKRLERMQQQVMADKDVQAFLKEQNDVINQSMIDRGLNKLYEYVQQSKQCAFCSKDNKTNSLLEGYHPKLVINGRSIDIEYYECPEKRKLDRQKRQKSLMKSMYIQKDLLGATFQQIDITDPSRLGIFQHVTDFLKSYNETGKGKGLYLYGKFGIGKTFILAAIANELAEKEYSSMIVYVPEFVRELKNSLQDQSLEEKLNMVKTTPVLMLDDIGAESMTSWVRDEVIGTVLQHRMSQQLPTFFSSNFSPDELKHHFTYSQRGEKEEVKAARLMERILYLASPVRLDGENRRRS